MVRSTVLLKSFPLMFFAEVYAGVFQDGFREGEIKARRVWIETFGSDCSEVLLYSDEINEKLVRKTYNYEQNLEWKEEAFRRGGREGATQEMGKNQKACLGIDYCEVIGKAAASKLSNEFCGIPYILEDMKKMEVQMCRQEAMLVCENIVRSKVGALFESKDNACYNEDQGVDSLSSNYLIMLQDACELQVMKLIAGDDSPIIEPTRNNDSDSDSDSNSNSNSDSDSDSDDEMGEKKEKEKKKKKKSKKNKKSKDKQKRRVLRYEEREKEE